MALTPEQEQLLQDDLNKIIAADRAAVAAEAKLAEDQAAMEAIQTTLNDDTLVKQSTALDALAAIQKIHDDVEKMTGS